MAQCQLLHTLILRDSRIWHLGALSECPALYEISLRHAVVKGPFDSLSKFPSLHNLDIRDSYVQSNLSELRRCASLRRVQVSGCRNTVDGRLRTFELLEPREPPIHVYT